MNERVELTLGHSPDADDVFMWWPLTGKLDPADGGATGLVISPPLLDTGRLSFKAVAADIESLNRRAQERGDLDITAMSFHAYPAVRGRYALTACGASMGDGYGPKVVRRRTDGAATGLVERLRSGRATIAVPGKRTTAFLTLCLMLESCEVRAIEMRFDRIIGAVAAEVADAGLVIHEGQLTYRSAGLDEVVDLGSWWKERTGLPLPLGANAVRRDLDERLGSGTSLEVVRLLTASIAAAIQRPDESLTYAAEFAPGATLDQVRRFVNMYVNDLTIDAGDRGRRAIQRLLSEGANLGLCPNPGTISLLGGSGNVGNPGSLDSE